MIEKQYIAIGERTKKIRIILGLSRKELGEKLNVGANFIGHIEQGLTIPTPLLMLLLADSYKVSINYLLTGVGVPFIDNATIIDSNAIYNSDFADKEKIKNLEKQVELLTELLTLKKN
jgi:transcriptional regulator with XRE-family HTH domain